MRKYINKNMLYFLIAMCFISIGGVLATISTTNKVINKVSIDTVDIELNEYMVKDDQLVDFEYIDYIYPGNLISLVPQVKNLGVDAYIRMKIDFSQFEDEEESINESLEILSLTNVNGFEDEKWIYKNGYYYFQDILKEEQVISLFESIQIPSEWDNSYQALSFDVNVEVDAVQAKNFLPDYESTNPWGDVVPEKTVRTRMDR